MVWVLIFLIIWAIGGTVWLVKESTGFDAVCSSNMPVWYKIFYTIVFFFISGPLIIFALAFLILIILIASILTSS